MTLEVPLNSEGPSLSDSLADSLANSQFPQSNNNLEVLNSNTLPVISDVKKKNPDPCIRALKLGLRVPKELKATVLKHLECRTKAVASVQNVFLKMFGSLNASIIDTALAVEKQGKLITEEPSLDEKMQRRIILTRLWLFPVSVVGAESKYIIGDASKKKKTIPLKEAEKRELILRDILNKQGLSQPAIDEWLLQTKAELYAPVVEGKCLINARQMFLDDKENFGQDFDNKTAFEFLNYLVKSPGNLFSPLVVKNSNSKISSEDQKPESENYENQAIEAEQIQEYKIDDGQIEKEVTEDLVKADKILEDWEIENYSLENADLANSDLENNAPEDSETESNETATEESTNNLGKIKFVQGLDKSFIAWFGRVRPQAAREKTAKNYLSFIPHLNNLIEACKEIDPELHYLEALKQIAQNVNVIYKKQEPETFEPITDDFTGILELFGGKLKNSAAIHKLVKNFETKEAKKNKNNSSKKNSNTPANFAEKFALACQIDINSCENEIPRKSRPYAEHIIALIENAFGYPLAQEDTKIRRSELKDILGEAAREISKTLTNIRKASAKRILDIHETQALRDSISSEKRQVLENFCAKCNLSDGNRYFLNRGEFHIRKIVHAWQDKNLDTAKKRIKRAKTIVYSEEYRTKKKGGWRKIFEHLATNEGMQLMQTKDGNLDPQVVIDFFEARKLERQAQVYSAPALRFADIYISLRPATHSNDSGFKVSFDGLELGKRLAKRQKLSAQTLLWMDNFIAQNEALVNKLLNENDKTFSVWQTKLKNTIDSFKRSLNSIKENKPNFAKWKNKNKGTSQDFLIHEIKQTTTAESFEQILLTALAKDEAHYLENTYQRSHSEKINLSEIADFIDSYQAQVKIQKELIKLGQKAHRKSTSNKIKQSISNNGDTDSLPFSIGTVRLEIFDGAKFVTHAFKIGGERFKQEILLNLYNQYLPDGENLPQIPRDTTFTRAALGLNANERVAIAGLLTEKEWSCKIKLEDNVKNTRKQLALRNDLSLEDRGAMAEKILKSAQFNIVIPLNLNRPLGGLSKYFKENNLELLDSGELRNFIKARNVAENRDSYLSLHRLNRLPPGLRLGSVKFLKSGRSAVVSVVETMSAEQVELECVKRGAKTPLADTQFLILRGPAAFERHEFKRTGPDKIINPEGLEILNPSPWARIERTEFISLPGEGHKDRTRKTRPFELDLVKEIAQGFNRPDLPNSSHQRLSSIREYLNETLRKAVGRHKSRALIAYDLNPDSAKPKVNSKFPINRQKMIAQALKEWRRLALDNVWPDKDAKESFDREIVPLFSAEQNKLFADKNSQNKVLDEIAEKLAADSEVDFCQRLSVYWQKRWQQDDESVSLAIDLTSSWYAGSTKLRPIKVEIEEQELLKFPSDGGLSLKRQALENEFVRIEQAYVTRPTPFLRCGNPAAPRIERKYKINLENRTKSRHEQLVAEITRVLLGMKDLMSDKNILRPYKLDDPITKANDKIVRYAYEKKKLRAKYIQKYPPCHVCLLELEPANVKGVRSKGDNAKHAALGQQDIKNKLEKTLELLDIGFLICRDDIFPRDYRSSIPGISCSEIKANDFLDKNGKWWLKIKEAEARINESRQASLSAKKIAKERQPSAIDRYIFKLYESLNQANHEVLLPFLVPDRNGNIFVGAGPQHQFSNSNNIHKNTTLCNAFKQLEDPDYNPHIFILQIDKNTQQTIKSYVKGCRIVSATDKISVRDLEPADPENLEEFGNNGQANKRVKKDKKADCVFVYRNPSNLSVNEAVWQTWSAYLSDIQEGAISCLNKHLVLDRKPKEKKDKKKRTENK